MDQSSESLAEQSKSFSKTPVVRGARACQVCRAAKMKCVGAEDGQKQCQRCKRANVDCVFEKHRRGRKPGSKLSEASKMLRRLEKGLNTAKLKSQSNEAIMATPYSSSDSRTGSSDLQLSGAMRSSDQYGSPNRTPLPANDHPALNAPVYQRRNEYSHSSSGSRTMDMEEEEEDNDRPDEGLFPAKMIGQANQRNSFFRTILNPDNDDPSGSGNHSHRSNSLAPPPRAASIPVGLNDPITAGLIDEEGAKTLFDLLFLRLNPFINLFDPSLHSVSYVRSKCPFLFTTLIMAGCKFFRAELFKQCQKLANEFAIRAFAESWKGVEVVQAFACLTYWKDPDDTRTWTYIGYACRMAVELDLNRHVSNQPLHENEFQMRERRNRERTYLVLWIHDRSLSMQTGRHWMLPEDDLVRHSTNWHEEGGTLRPEDVIVAAFVQLRRIAAETTEMFYTAKGTPGVTQTDVNYEVVLRSCNNKLTEWMDTWQREMQRAGGQSFHFSFLSFFRLYDRLFLNSFGIQSSMTTVFLLCHMRQVGTTLKRFSQTSRASPSLQALTACCTSALETLQIVSRDFASMSMLRYGQDSITVMVAYSAIFLLKLIRSSNTLASLHEGTAREIHSLIAKTAEAYFNASLLSPESTSAAYHARFLRSLIANDIFKPRRNEREKLEGMPIDPRLQAPQSSSISPSSHQIYTQPILHTHDQSFHFPASPHLPTHPAPHEYGAESTLRNGSHGHQSYPSQMIASTPHHASELDAHYWRNMFLELGFGENNIDQPRGSSSDVRGMPPYNEVQSQPQHNPQCHSSNHQQGNAHQANNHHMQTQLPYHHMQSSQQTYGH